MSSATINSAAILGIDEFGDESSTGMLLHGSYALPVAVAVDPRLVAGSLGSVVSALVSQPFEVAKVKLQSNCPSMMIAGPASSYFSSSGNAPSIRTSPGVLSTLRHVMAKEGVQGIFAGLAPTMVMTMPNYMLYLTAYDEIASSLKHNQAMASLFSSPALYENSVVPLTGGALARFIATTAIAPLEMLRTRDASMKSPRSNSTGSSHFSRIGSDLTTIVRNDGVGALYRGILPALGRDVPFAAIYMLCLEKFRDATRPFWRMDDMMEATSTKSVVTFEFVNAALAGMVAATCSAPLDVVKTRLQSDRTGSSSNSKETTFHVFRSIVHREGLAGLWRGNQARMLKVAPQYAIMISFYEVGKKALT